MTVFWGDDVVDPPPLGGGSVGGDAFVFRGMTTGAKAAYALRVKRNDFTNLAA